MHIFMAGHVVRKKGRLKVALVLDLSSAHLSVFELVQGEVEGTQKLAQQNHWIGLSENLNRKPWFLPSNIGLSCKFSLKPIQ
jgi:hypothetical protein